MGNTFSINKTYKHFKRYRDVLRIFIKYGFQNISDHVHLKNFIPGHKKAQPSLKGADTWTNVRKAFEELGPAFIKFGQIMSSRGDIFPTGLIKELRKLQDEVSPVSLPDINHVFIEEFGKPPEEIFKSFSESPIASASIAQVHQAVLPDGQKVAVKVQRPGITEIIKTDLEILTNLSGFVEMVVRETQLLGLKDIIQFFKKQLTRELNFKFEINNILHFKNDFKNHPHLIVPKPFTEYSTEKVLTMSFIDGKKISDIAEQSDKTSIVKRGADILLRQIFFKGFFHGDPHQGNILVFPENKICFLDFGIMGIVTGHQKKSLSYLMIGLDRHNEKYVTKALLELCNNKLNDVEKIKSLENEIAFFIEQFAYLSVRDIDIEYIFNQFFELLIKYRLLISENFFLLIKALVILQTTAAELDPNFSVFEYIKPYAKKLIKSHFQANKIIREFQTAAFDYSDFIRDIPQSLIEIFQMVRTGNTQIKFRHRGLEPLIASFEEISRRIVFGVVLAALLISSSLMVLSRVAPLWKGVPLFGAAGFLLSGIMGIVYLFYAVLHKRNSKK